MMKKPLIFLLLVVSSVSYSLSIELDLLHNDLWLGVSAKLKDYQSDELLTNINQGFIAEINFYFKLFQKQNSRSLSGGDKLLFEVKRISRAYKDYFDDLYIVEKGGEKIFFSDKDKFEESFLSMIIDQLIQIDSAEKNFYLMGRIEIIPVVLNSPLHLIEILNPIAISTPWERLEINGR